MKSVKFIRFPQAATVMICLMILSGFGCVKREVLKPPTEMPPQTSANALNINTASVAELEKLPRIGAGFAQKIVEHREKYGKFQRIEEIMLVEGIGEARFRAMREMIKVE